jgi:uncharacterized protein
MDLTGSTALVTGASGGIGEEFAVRLAAGGVDLVLVARRGDRLDALRSRLLADHPDRTIATVTADLAEPGAGAALVGQLDGQRIDVLVNNAGVGSHGPFADQDADAAVALAQLNVVTLTDLTARLLPPMLATGRGAVINVASTAAFQPVPTMAVYAATKAYVLSFTEALWWETHRSGVRVLALCPGATETEFFRRTGEQFMTRGRQQPDAVVRAALAALDGSGPTVVPGLRNKVSTFGARLAPRRFMPFLAGTAVSPTG